MLLMKRRRGGPLFSGTVETLAVRAPTPKTRIGDLKARRSGNRGAQERREERKAGERRARERVYEPGPVGEWKRRILEAFKTYYPDVYKCYENPWLCARRGRGAVEPETMISAREKIKGIYALAKRAEKLAGKFRSTSDRDNPARQLAWFYRALVEILSRLYRWDPAALASRLGEAARFLRASLRKLEDVAKREGVEWSRERCTLPGCVTASSPFKLGSGRRVRLELVALAHPKRVRALAGLGRVDPVSAHLVYVPVE